jgi:lysophospholipase L1-like esterase
MSGGPGLGRLASAILIAAALPALGVLALALPRLSGAASADQVVFFAVLPALWLVGMGVAMRAPVMVRLSVALLLVSLGAAAVLAEAGLGLWFSRARTPSATPSILSEVLAMRAAGTDAYPKIPGNSLVDMDVALTAVTGTWHPVTPAPGNTTVLLCNEEGPLVSYEGDWAGFDNPQDAWAPERVDVALIGDSYTVGVCVEGERSLGGQLRRRWSTLNLGSSGVGPLQELAILREYAATKRPAVVVWVYYEGNDLWDLAREAQRDWLTAYLEPDHTQSLVANQAEVDGAYRAWIDSLAAAEDVAAGAAAQALPGWSPRDVVTFTSLRAMWRFKVLVPSREPALGRLPEVLTQARSDVAAWGGRLYVAYMPAYERYDALVGEAVAGRRELTAFADSAGIPFIDLDAALRAAGDPRELWASPRGHLSPEGYRVAADAIADAIAPTLPPPAIGP